MHLVCTIIYIFTIRQKKKTLQICYTRILNNVTALLLFKIDIGRCLWYSLYSRLNIKTDLKIVQNFYTNCSKARDQMDNIITNNREFFQSEIIVRSMTNVMFLHIHSTYISQNHFSKQRINSDLSFQSLYNWWGFKNVILKCGS